MIIILSNVCVCDNIFYFILLNVNFKTHKTRNKNASMTTVKNLKIS